MSVKKFIETGIIESYVLGLCTPQELKQVKAMRDKHPTIKAEIKSVREALLGYAIKHEVKPPEQLKKELFDWAKSSEQKPAEKKKSSKTPEEKVAVTKAPAEKKQDVKPQEKKSDIKTPEPASSGVKPSEEIKPASGTSEANHPGVKISEAKIPEGKPSEVKKEVAASSERKETPLSFKTVKPEIKTSKEPVSKKEDEKRFETVKSFLLVVTLALLLASAYFSYSLYEKTKSIEKQLTDLNEGGNERIQQLRAEAETLQNQLVEKQMALDTQVQKAASLVHDRKLLLKSYTDIPLSSEAAVTFTGKEMQSDASATIFWNKASGEVFISVQNLSRPDSMHQYQLWSMVNGNFSAAGVFEAGDGTSMLQRVKKVKTADFFVVTLENKEGNLKPTVDATYLVGKTF